MARSTKQQTTNTQTPKQFANEIREIRNAKDLQDTLTIRTPNGAKTKVPRPADAPKAETHTPQPVKEEKMATKTKKGATRKTAPKGASRKVPTNRCQCGCNGLTRGNFVPGHDQRLVGMIKRGDLRSLTSFQAEFAKNHGIRLGESKKAEKAKTETRGRKPARAA